MVNSDVVVRVLLAIGIGVCFVYAYLAGRAPQAADRYADTTPDGGHPPEPAAEGAQRTRRRCTVAAPLRSGRSRATRRPGPALPHHPHPVSKRSGIDRPATKEL